MPDFRLFSSQGLLYREASDTGVMMHRIPGQEQRRFFQHDNILMSIVEAMIYLRDTSGELVAKDFLVANLLTISSLVELKQKQPMQYGTFIGICLAFISEAQEPSQAKILALVRLFEKRQVVLEAFRSSFDEDSFQKLLSVTQAVQAHALDDRYLIAYRKIADVFPKASVLANSMQKLYKQLEQMDVEKVDPFFICALLHQGIIAIHPLADGNGRLARARVDDCLKSYQLSPLFMLHPRGENSSAEIAYDLAAATADVARFADYLRWRYIELYPQDERVIVSRKLATVIAHRDDEKVASYMRAELPPVAVNLPTKGGGYPLHYAVKQGRVDWVGSLLVKGASSQVWSKNNSMPDAFCGAEAREIKVMLAEKSWNLDWIWGVGSNDCANDAHLRPNGGQGSEIKYRAI